MQNSDQLETELLLPAINPSLQDINITRSSKSYTYYRALKDLKQITKKLHAVNNRMKILNERQSQAKHPISQYFQERGEKLRHQANQYNKKYEEQLQVIHQKSISEVSLKRTKNEHSKQSHKNRLSRAKRIVTEQKFKAHDFIRMHSLENKKIIEQLQKSTLTKKQEKHRRIFQKSRKSLQHKHQLQESRAILVREEYEEATKNIMKKIKIKEAQLKSKARECQEKQEEIRSINLRRNKNIKKLRYSYKPNTVETRTTHFYGKEGILTPRSALSFVIIQ